VLVRVGFVVVAIASGGLGALLYIVLAIVMPEGGRAEGEEEQRNDGSDGRTRDVLAIALIVIGAVLLLGNLGPWFEWRYVLPALLILIGAAMIIGRVRHS
jgi:hypothetical protein